MGRKKKETIATGNWPILILPAEESGEPMRKLTKRGAINIFLRELSELSMKHGIWIDSPEDLDLITISLKNGCLTQIGKAFQRIDWKTGIHSYEKDES